MFALVLAQHLVKVGIVVVHHSEVHQHFDFLLLRNAKHADGVKLVR